MGSNTVIIAHGFPNEIELEQIPNMGTFIVKPLGLGNGYDIINISRKTMEKAKLGIKVILKDFKNIIIYRR